jgi:hypothetical protein
VTPSITQWSSPLSFLQFSQPGGTGSGVQVRNGWLIPGHEYFNVFSVELCPNGLGTGPYGGLCFTNPADLLLQLQLPVGSAPFHIVAASATETLGPYPVPPGFAFEAISVDWTGGGTGCISPAVGYTTF